VFSVLSDLASLAFISEREVVAFSTVGLTTAAAVMTHFPKRYEDRRSFDYFPNTMTSVAVCLCGVVADVLQKHYGSGRQFCEVIVEDSAGGIFGSGKITCRWFQMQFIQKAIVVGQTLIVYGKVKDERGRLIIDHPEFEVVCEGDHKLIHVERIVPIYKNLAGISQRRLREIIYLLLGQVEPASLASDIDMNADVHRDQSFRDVHFPESLQQASIARRRFAFEAFFVLQLNVIWRRTRYLERAGRVLGNKTTYLKQFYSKLPFDFTEAQKRSIKEILADMRIAQPMNRLLQGDVGSGKTFVAMAAMLLAIESGCQAALMAPTQILAEQHYLTFCHWLSVLGVRVTLRTGNRSEENYQVGTDKPQIIIGTHALLYDSSLFHDLGLIVIDEQHKFGVSQRVSLISKGLVPDVLVMTATPIPRTLAMTVYGDLAVSVLDEKPAGRGKITTGIRIKAKQLDVTKFIKEQLAVGRQVYLVYPLVEESEALKVESANAAFVKWKKRLNSYEVGLIHGKLKPEEKETVMRRFRSGEISVLVATSVIEVGVDVPNASVMVIHHAERFGLAQLHQLRGRIGRGGHKAYCILLTDGKNSESLEKLRIIERTTDGFEIAEADLRMRGPGDVLGKMQSGLSDIRFVDFLADTSLLQDARVAAEKVLAADPFLVNQYQSLRKFIHENYDIAALPTTA
jgi:ATP-dependent DNA helicase RecG